MPRGASISATFTPQTRPHVVADRAGLAGATPSAVVRYLAYRLAGRDEQTAREQVLPRRDLSAFNNRPRKEAAEIPAETLADIQRRFPGKSISYLLRFQAAKESGADDEVAHDIASSISAGRPKGAKDARPRTRRSREELTAS